MSSQTDQKQSNQIGSQTYKIITQYGDMLVVKQGIHSSHHHQHNHHQANNQQEQQQQQQQQQQSRPVIMTFHDLGLNSELQFATFCESDEVKLMLQTFNLIHVNFIGQEFSANGQMSKNLPPEFKFPSVDQMAECIVDVCAQLRVRSFIALAVGAGAHIVGQLALMRPDLVDGLFLINPIVTSCSITEWLYFKMSDIASSHHVGSGSDHHNQSPSDQSPTNARPTGGGGGGGSMGLRKLLHAAHVHLPHQGCGHQTSPVGGSQATASPKSTALDDKKNNEETGTGTGTHVEEDTRSLGQASSLSGSSMSSVQAASPGGSRLRRLILSRNFHLGGHHRHHREHHSPPVSGNRPSSASACELIAPATSGESPKMRSQPLMERKGSKDSTGSNDSRSSASSNGRRRAPYEYLMYHHFGPSSFQRYRRSSDTPADFRLPSSSASESPNNAGKGSTSGADTTNASDRVLDSSAATCSRRSSPSSSISSGRRVADASSRRPVSSPQTALRRSHDSLETSRSGTGDSQRARSDSVYMTASYLASFPTDHQRHAYMHAVYKHYFSQLNAHNLWLFAQSFAKRRTLNLRKDCGAAAHAAAAAAALGTSICNAFVGVGPPASGGPSGAVGARKTAATVGTPERRKGDAGSNSRPANSQQPEIESSQREQSACGKQNPLQKSSSRPQHQQQQQQQALVAGTKVKRTFTCQTLIMCSSVQLHCERAFKLMSLLNPLQATWIKTDQLLVLEERPEKVCQALRLFLQGIGYSMSTYERRLRLSSHTGSVSSADSSGSGPSSSNERG